MSYELIEAIETKLWEINAFTDLGLKQVTRELDYSLPPPEEMCFNIIFFKSGLNFTRLLMRFDIGGCMSI